MADDHFYIGIDLGTTNSVIAWGRMVKRFNYFEPSVLEVEHLGRGMKAFRTELLPSAVYFPEGGAPIVGEAARSDAFATQPHLVARSVKNRMGSGEDITIQGRGSFSPAYVSSLILNQLRAATKDKFGTALSDAVITVPASFDADMRADTLEAAQQAGFKVTAADGRPRDMLLDEPRAALHYLIYQQQMEEIPSSLIEFTSPKTVLIFDLGGGTLDVSLHRVQADYEDMDLSVEDIAISRYTQIGGDNFDQLIADHFQRAFEKKYDIRIADIPEDYIRHEISGRLLLEAESKKRALNDQFAQGIKQQATFEMLRPRIKAPVQIPNLYDNRTYWEPLSWDELEMIIAPLMGHDLTIENVAGFESLSAEHQHNIIYPVLDVLSKAERRLGQVPEIDAVFLNGGMTRFLPIRMRLESFFGMEPLTLLDPDKSVALGATLYHRALHQGKRPRAVILAETIGMEVNDGYVKHLVPAGTVVPMPAAQPMKGLIIPEGTSQITIPFYRGERKDTQEPNVRLLERVVRLPRACLSDEPVNAEVFVDANKILTFRAHLVNHPDVEIEVKVSSTGPAQPAPLSQSASSPPAPVIPEPTGSELDVAATIEQLLGSTDLTEGEIKQGLEAAILDAPNRAAFIGPLARALPKLSLPFRIKRVNAYRRALLILGRLGQWYSDHEDTGAVLGALMRVSASRYGSNGYYVNTIVQAAVTSIGRLSNSGGEGALIDVLNDPEAEGAYQMAMVALAKVASSANAMAVVTSKIDHGQVGIRMNASWAAGKIGSRDHEPAISASVVLPAVDLLVDCIEKETHATARQMEVYAMGELCDQRNAANRDIVPAAYAEKAISTFNNIRVLHASGHIKDSDYRYLDKTLSLASAMIHGAVLKEEQERNLFRLRATFADA
jgi:molecular chaperone DnaK (HSP70)